MKLYNIQFEDEGTFYVNNIKVDSLSPNFKKDKLPLELYFDKLKYIEDIVTSEDNKNRNKPPMTDVCYSICVLGETEFNSVHDLLTHDFI